MFKSKRSFNTYLEKVYLEDQRNLLPKDFDAYLDKYHKGSMDGFLCEYDLLEEEEEDIEELYDINSDRYDNWIYKYRTINFPLTLYRNITLKSDSVESIADIKLSKQYKKGNMGIYWTDDEDYAIAYYGGDGSEFILRSKINEGDVDWKDTLFMNMDPSLGDEENEIRLYKNRQIKLTGIKKKKDKKWTELDFVIKI